MIAIPIDTKKSTTISQLYGNSPYFAFLDEESGEFNVLKNKGCSNGGDTAEFVLSQNADKTIFYHMGQGVFDTFVDGGGKVYTALKNHLSIDEIYEKALSNSLKEVTKENCDELLDSGSATCTCSAR